MLGALPKAESIGFLVPDLIAHPCARLWYQDNMMYAPGRLAGRAVHFVC